jgi:quinol monooxygenase YgiN
MPTLPWTTAANAPASTRDALIMASRFRLETWTDVPGFLLAALRIRTQMLASPGALGVSLIAQPLRKTFYTLSAWQDRAALDRAVGTQPHAATMTRFRPKMASAVFTFWEGEPRPEWPDARHRLEMAGGYM